MAVLVITAKPEAESCNPKRRGPLPEKFGSLQRAKPSKGSALKKLRFSLTANGRPVSPGS